MPPLFRNLIDPTPTATLSNRLTAAGRWWLWIGTRSYRTIGRLLVIKRCLTRVPVRGVALQPRQCATRTSTEGRDWNTCSFSLSTLVLLLLNALSCLNKRWNKSVCTFRASPTVSNWRILRRIKWGLRCSFCVRWRRVRHLRFLVLFSAIQVFAL